MTMTINDIATTQSRDFFNRQKSFDKQFDFDSIISEDEYKQTFGAAEFYVQCHEVSTGLPSSAYPYGHEAENPVPSLKRLNTEAALDNSDDSVLSFTPESEVFRTDVQHCNSQMCLACRPSRFDHATRFLRVPKVTPEDIPKLPNKWWSEQTYDSNWVDKFWTSLTKIMDGDMCGPVKYCGGETIKCKTSSAVNKYERDKH